jgi:2-polyprenyl-3-methyl-5-hydroxy-6-metoxy-1,4-benzoquinol methylase
VTRQRLRPSHTAEQLAEIYPQPHDHRRWRDHHVRVDATIALARGIEGVTSVADLSCGNGAIAKAVGAETTILGDYAPGYDICGPIEDTIHVIPEVDLYICSESIEHLDDPDTVLKFIRAKVRHLVLTTPVDNWGDANIEHYWAWSRQDVEQMLAAAGWTVQVTNILDMRGAWSPYCFGMWVCC